MPHLFIESVEVIDNESDAPGTILKDWSEAFHERFRQADLVIVLTTGADSSLTRALWHPRVGTAW